MCSSHASIALLFLLLIAILFLVLIGAADKTSLIDLITLPFFMIAQAIVASFWLDAIVTFVSILSTVVTLI